VPGAATAGACRGLKGDFVGFLDAVQTAPLILTEGALLERLRRDPTVALDPHALHAGFIYQERGREALRRLYREYLDIGAAFDLPMIVCTPTWRANPVRLQRAGLAHRDVNGDAVRFVASIRGEYGLYAKRVFVGGLVGCMGDAYKPDEGLPAGEAAAFHGAQTKALAAAGADFLLAAALPNVEEARGIAIAMTDCHIPFVLSFVLGQSGRLLDETPLHDAVAAIDAAVSPRPLFYMVNCVHPTVFEVAMVSWLSRSRQAQERVIGLQANASRKSPEELEGLSYVDADDPGVLADAILRVHHRLGTKILGGCCGTDERHIACIARRAKECARPIL
jgi:homocysteine S-methyltransferase